MNFKAMTAQLQSHVAKRAHTITANEMWREAYKFMGRRKDAKQTDADLKELRASQSLDKRLLRMTNEMAYMDVLMSQGEWEEY